MSPKRLVLVTRRFWPLVGGAEAVMANLAAELHAQGHRVTLLTAQWEAAWPDEIHHRGVRVLRLPQPQISFVGTLVYIRELARWLRRHAGEIDLAYVSMLKHDAFGAIAAARAKFPVVLRAEGAGETGDCHWQLEARCGRRIKQRCQQAQALVAPSPAIERELIAAGFARTKIVSIPNGVAIPVDETEGATPGVAAETRRDARAALAVAHPGLTLAADAPLAVYTGRLHENKGLFDLVDAWPLISARRPSARLWFVGEGPLRQALAERIESRGLGNRMMVAGPFDKVDEVLEAADLYVLPSREEGMSLALLEAMAAGLPVVASDIPGNRLLVEHGQHGLLTPVGEVEALAEAINRLWDEPALARRLADSARARVAAEYSLARMCDEHLRLFERLIADFRS